jgi:TetR/AcrR family transcriptional regulator
MEAGWRHALGVVLQSVQRQPASDRVLGATQGAVFKHFPTKDAIGLAATRWVRETLLQRLQAAADRAATPLDALAGIFRVHVEFVIVHPGVLRFIFHELQQAADSAAKLEVRGVLQG